jgi:tetratricopeptide (TPR) repeat protein
VNKASFSTSSMFAEYPPVRKRSAFSTRFGVPTKPSRSGSSPSSASSLLTRSCIALFYISTLAISAAAQNADTLYADRANLASATTASALWSEAVKRDPRDFEAAWKLARVSYWLGGHAPEKDRRGHLESGMQAARAAIALEPQRPEGHFWLAANMGTLAESFGLRNGLRYRGAVRDELETVLKLDPSFMNGSADRVLGRWYFRVPRLFGGSNRRAEEHLRASLQYDANSTISRFFLAEVLIDEDRKDEARTELQKVIDAPLSEEWAPEDQEYKAKATALLGRLK